MEETAKVESSINTNQEQEEPQEVWSWGAGTEGQLGTGKLEDEHSPQLLNFSFLSSMGRISILACGGAHVLALTSGRKVFSWGRGSSGQLGHGDMINSLCPKPVTFFDSYSITHISAGWSHSGFVSDSGYLFTCGDGTFGQLGHGDYRSHCSPVKVSYFVNKSVEQIACGMRHSLVLLKDCLENQVYGFGSGKRGQLGISKDRIRSVSLPQVTNGFEDVEIVGICANGDRSAALSEGSNFIHGRTSGEAHKRDVLIQICSPYSFPCCTVSVASADGHIYTWGRGFNSSSDVHSPQFLPSSASFRQAALGWNHALVLNGDGEVSMLGGYHHGALSDLEKVSPTRHLYANSNEVALEKVSSLDGVKAVQIAAGAEHSAVVTDNGEIMTWGWGEHGQLGLGNTCDRTHPEAVNLGDEVPNKDARFRIYCGSGFTYAISTSCLDAYSGDVDRS